MHQSTYNHLLALTDKLEQLQETECADVEKLLFEYLENAREALSLLNSAISDKMDSRQQAAKLLLTIEGYYAHEHIKAAMILKELLKQVYGFNYLVWQMSSYMRLI